MESLQLIILIVHILLAALLVGMAFYSFAAVFKPKLSPTDLNVFKAVRRYGHILAIIQFIVGGLLVVISPQWFLKNPLVWTKVILFLLDGIVSVIIIQRRLEQIESGQTSKKAELMLKRAAFVSLLLFATITILGVLVSEH